MNFTQIFFVAGLAVGNFAAAETLPQQLKNCARFTADHKRLACYDALSIRLKQHAEQRFGIESKQRLDEGPDTLVATIASLRKGPHGKHTIILANGQVWRQTTSGRINWKDGQQIEIARGALGSFLMRKRSGGKSIRVKRLD